MTDALSRLTSALSDRYTIERELGRGGMATVYLAEDLKLHRKVALKVLRPELASALGPDRFLQEIDIAAKLNHPHILGLFDCGEADGFLYYVMPYVEGQSLRDKLAHEGELPIPEAVRILRDVVDALSHAHKHNVVHRDIKPDNVMLSDRHALVTDFGVAKAVSEATGRQQLTTEGVALGTPTYMAPEQAAADPHIDHRADIYAVGAVAYELLTGRPPFLGTTPQMILSAHMTDAPDPVTKYRDAVPPVLEQLVLKCLEKKAADRWQSADELLPQLEALATPSGGTTPVGTVPISAVKRSRTMAIGASALAVILAVIVVVMLLPRGSGITLDPERIVVAVFRNVSGDPSLDQVGERAGHWITQGLQQAAVKVVPWQTARQSWQYVEVEAEAGRARDLVRALADETGAGIVVDGAVYVDGDSVQIQADLTDAMRGQVLGSIAPVTGSRSAVGDVIATLQQQLMGFLAVHVDEALSDFVDMTRKPPSFEAYEAFNQGWDYHRRLDYASAEPFFRQASELDPDWAQPLLRLRQVLVNVGTRAEQDSVVTLLETMWDKLTPYEQAVTQTYRADFDGNPDLSLESIRRAAQLAPRSPAVYNYANRARNLNRPREAVDALRSLDPERGWVREYPVYWIVLTDNLHMLGEYDQELSAAQTAFQLHPDEGARMLSMQTRALAALGRVEALDGVLDQIEVARDLRWIRSASVEATEILRANGHVEASLRVAERAIRWFDARPSAEATDVGHRYWYGRALFLAGRIEESQMEFDEIVDEQPDSLSYRAFRAFIAVQRGDTVQAMRDAEWLDVYLTPDVPGAGWRLSPLFWEGVIAAALGERQQAVAYLRESYVQGRLHRWYDRVRVEFDPLRDYPPFQELMRPKG